MVGSVVDFFTTTTKQILRTRNSQSVLNIRVLPSTGSKRILHFQKSSFQENRYSHDASFDAPQHQETKSKIVTVNHFHTMSYSKPQFNKRGGNDRNNWAQSRPQLQSEGILVQTNAFSLTVEKVVTIHQYLVQMISCRWVRHPETKANLGLKLNRKPIFSNTEALDSSHLTEKEKEDESKRNRSSDFSRRILNQLQQKLKPHQIFVRFLFVKYFLNMFLIILTTIIFSVPRWHQYCLLCSSFTTSSGSFRSCFTCR